MHGKSRRIGVASSLVVLALVSVLALAGCNGSSAQSSSSTTTTVATSQITVESQSIGLTGVKNARDIGGYVGYNGKTIKHGLLIRSGKLASATEDDIAILKGFNLSTVIDLRADFEKTASPDPTIDGVTSVGIPVESNYIASFYVEALKTDEGKSGGAGLSVAAAKAGLDPTAAMEDVFFDENNAPLFKEFFDTLLAQPDGQALLWHCTYGKDRTGATGVLLLSALGVDRETVLDDYALTNDFLASDISEAEELAKTELTDETQIANVKGIAGVDRDAMEATLDKIDSQYGSVDNYLKQFVGLSDTDIQALRDKYLE